ncbi:MAG: hypothetical protein AAFV98_20145, partial [Chloroflexota bacterium]
LNYCLKQVIQHGHFMVGQIIACVEESVYCALLNAKTITGVNGHTLNALPHEAVRRWLVHYNRLS